MSADLSLTMGGASTKCVGDFVDAFCCAEYLLAGATTEVKLSPRLPNSNGMQAGGFMGGLRRQAGKCSTCEIKGMANTPFFAFNKMGHTFALHVAGRLRSIVLNP